MNRSPQAVTQSMSESGKLICVGDPTTLPSDIARESVILVDTSIAVVDALKEPSIDGVWIARDQLPQISELRGLAQSGLMLRDMPEGVALMDSDMRVLWANDRLIEWAGTDNVPVAGRNFYELLSNPEIMGPDFCPFHTALATSEESTSTLHSAGNRYYQIHAAPIVQSNHSRQLIVTVSDVTDEILQQQKLAAIHQAGRELADLRPTEIFMMEVDDRIDLLKENIRHYLSDLSDHTLALHCQGRTAFRVTGYPDGGLARCDSGGDRPSGPNLCSRHAGLFRHVSRHRRHGKCPLHQALHL